MPSSPTWTMDDVRAFVDGYGLRDEGLAAAALEGGADNLNLLVHREGQQLVLRRYSRTPSEEIEWELQLIRFLSARGFPTPAVFPRADGGLSGDFLGRPAALFSFVPGRDADPESPEEGAQTAGAIAELHLLTRGLHLPHARSDTGRAWLELLDGMATRLTSPGLAEMAAQAREFRAAFDARVAAVGGELPTGIVHHDANPGNVLLDDAGQFVALIDFDEAHEGELLTDVASLLRVWATPDSWQGLEEEMTAALLSAYDARRPLLAEEWELLPDFLLLFTLADAAGYVTGALAGDPTRAAVLECNAWRRFQELEKERGWTGLLRPR